MEMQKCIWKENANDVNKIIIRFQELPSSSRRRSFLIAALILLSRSPLEVRVDHVEMALNDMKRSGNNTLDGLNDAYLANSQNASKGTHNWMLYYPAQVYGVKLPCKFCIGEQVIWMKSENSVIKNLKKCGVTFDDLYRNHIALEAGQLSTYYFVMNIRVKSLGDAISSTYTSLNVLRGVMDLERQSRRLLGGENRPISICPAPLWVIAIQNESWNTLIQFHGETNSQRLDLPSERRKRIFKILRQYNAVTDSSRSKGSIESLLANCLDLYSSALDAKFDHQKFLGLWQVLEAITKAEGSGGNTDVVCKRLIGHARTIGLAEKDFSLS